MFDRLTAEVGRQEKEIIPHKNQDLKHGNQDLKHKNQDLKNKLANEKNFRQSRQKQLKDLQEDAQKSAFVQQEGLRAR